MLPQALLLILFQIISMATSTQLVYYVTATNSSWDNCPGQPCRTLDQYTQQVSFTTGSKFIFLPGNHTTQTAINLSYVSGVTLKGTSDAKIVCRSEVTVKCHNASNVLIEDLTLVSDGTIENSTALNITFSMEILISNSTFLKNTNLSNGFAKAMYVLASTVSVLHCQFEGNTGYSGGAIEGVHSDVALIGNVFVENGAQLEGGAVHLSYSSVKLARNEFLSNSAKGKGGALYCRRCNLSITDSKESTTDLNEEWLASNTSSSGIFRDNFARYGGAMYITDYSVVIITTNNLDFTSNWAHRCGGAISTFNTRLYLGKSSGDAIFFANNSAHRGGAIEFSVDRRNLFVIETRGHVFLYSNSAYDGGALHVSFTDLNFMGVSLFRNNSAASDGGAMKLFGCTFLFNGSAMFEGNTAERGGGIQSKVSEFIFISNQAMFMGNIARERGGGMHLSFGSSGAVITGSFIGNIGVKCGGAVAIQDGLNITFNGITFTENSGSALCIIHRSNITFNGRTRIQNNTGKFGGGINSKNSFLLFMNNTRFDYNHASAGGAIYSLYGTISFSGTTLFSYNTAETDGGGLNALGSSIHLKNAVNFTSNSAQRGGAMYFTNAASLTLMTITNLTTSCNYAHEYGGAMYHDDFMTPAQCNFDVTDYQDNEVTALPYCFVRINGISFHGRRAYNLPKTIIASYNDTCGREGDYIYGGLLDKCQIPDLKFIISDYPNEGLVWYTLLMERLKIVGLDNSTVIGSITSLPYQLCFCTNDQEYNCSENMSIEVYRGQKFGVPLLAVDQVRASVSSLVTAKINQSARLKINQSIQWLSQNCSKLSYTLFSTEDHEDLTLYPDGPCRDTGLAKALIRVTLLPCPDVFVQSREQCVCEKRLQAYDANCTIEDGIYVRRKAGSRFWMSTWYSKNKTYQGLILYKTCPAEYCKTDTVDISLDRLDIQCESNRTGMLCGACASGYSLIFGGSPCKICSNNYLALLIPFAAAGIVLVTFLSILKLTVATGLINSLILYANIVQVNKTIFIPNNSRNVLTVFIAWLNLDLGFESCFYNGMNAYEQTWLQFAFPVYVWILICLIILVSRYSISVSKMIGHNPVAVLATLLLMSYTKVLKIVIEVYSFVELDYPGNTTIPVWLKDANVPYLKSKHLLLAVVTALILVFIFLPYTFILFLGYKLYRFSGRKYFRWVNKIKPLLDSYYAPYTTHTRYWTGFLLLVRCALYIVFSLNSLGGSNRSLLVINTTFTGVLIIAWLFTKIYKDLHVNIVEAFIYFNLITLSAATATNTNSPALVYTLVGAVFAIMIATILYHLHLLCIIKSIVWHRAADKIHCLKETVKKHGTGRGMTTGAVLDVPVPTTSHDPHKIITRTVVDLREPLLEISQ